MKQILVFVIITALACTGVAGAQTPSSSLDSTDYWMRYVERLPIGSTVQVRTAGGQRMTGILAVVDDTGVIIQRKTRLPEPPTRIAYNELRQMELKMQGSSMGKAIAIGAGIGAGAFVGLLLIVASAWD